MRATNQIPTVLSFRNRRLRLSEMVTGEVDFFLSDLAMKHRAPPCPRLNLDAQPGAIFHPLLNTTKCLQAFARRHAV